jgi:hypothetical protein
MRALTLAGLVALASLAQLLPHPPNFTPVGAVALFGAAHFRSRWAAFLVPLAGLLVSDAALEVTTRFDLLGGWLARGRGFYPGMGVVYGAFALVIALGLLLRRKRTALAVGGCTLAGSVVFFLVTNLAVWAGGLLYPKTVEGLLTCYREAIPFFGWTLLGDACYATALFGGFALAERRFPVLRPNPA